MTFVPGFEHDVFISYSHTNNHSGWVTKFRQLLFGLLKERTSNDVTMFRDTDNLQGNDELTPTLLQAIRNAAVLVVVVSQNYLTRPWCLKECTEFINDNHDNLQRRIFVVRYDDVNVDAYQKVTGEMVGYHFFDRDDPYAATFEPDSNGFKLAINALRSEISEQLKELRKQATSPAPVPAKPSTQAAVPTIFLAQPAPGMSDAADRLAEFLTGLDYQVIRAGERFYKTENYENTFAASLKKSLLFVQLLGRNFDPHDDDRVRSWDRWQFLQAETAGLPVLRWFNKLDKDGNEIDINKLDADHRDFVSAPGVWNCEAPRFREVVRNEIEKRFHDRRQEERLSDDDAHPLVVVRSDRIDRQTAEEVGKVLNEQFACDWLRPREKDLVSLEELARACAANGLIVIYRSCRADWLLPRLQELRRFVTSEFGRRWVCALWRNPEDDEDPLSFAVNGVYVIEAKVAGHMGQLRQFIDRMRQRGSSNGASQ